MEAGLVMLTMVGIFLALWYGTLIVYERKRRARGTSRSKRSSSLASSVDAATQAAIDTVIICSTIDTGSHG